MDNLEKELRDKKILDLHNQGKSIAVIAKEMHLSKGGIHKIISGFILKGDSPKKEPVVKVKLFGAEERFTSFVGYERTNVNQYVHKETGEIVNVVFVKAKKAGEFGYFVKVSSVEKKSTASGEEVLETAAEV
jgi:hypothetical protein